MDLRKDLVDEASKWIGVTEKGKDNCGPEVEMFQKAVDGKASGESWCLAFVQYCLDTVLLRHGLEKELPQTEHCMTFWNQTPEARKSQSPEPGDIIIWNFAGSASGHAGIVTGVSKDGKLLYTIEGNTGPEASVNREGDGVYKKVRNRKGSSRMKVVGFVRPFTGEKGDGNPVS